MVEVLPFTCLKKYYNGERFEAVEVGAKWQLQSPDFVLAGMGLRPYEFASDINAEYWLESNLIRAAQKNVTEQSYLLRLQKKQAKTPSAPLAQEIATIISKNAGDWFSWQDLWIDGGAA